MNKDFILSVINQVIFDGGNNNFAIFHLGKDYYVQIAASRGDYEIHCEAISDYYLENGTLSPIQKQDLAKFGWKLPANSDGNYYQKHQVDTESSREALAELLENTASQVYHYSDMTSDNATLNLE